MEFVHYSPSETFIMLTADQFVGCDDGLLEQQKHDQPCLSKKWYISSDFKVKSES